MSDVDPENNSEFFDQFLDDFFAEFDEHLVLIRRSLLALEDSLGRPLVDRKLLDDLFRSFHTLKGISGMVGLTAAEQLAHHQESYLRELREGSATLSQVGFEALVEGVAGLEAVVSARRSDQAIPSIESITERLKTVTQQPTAQEPQQATETMHLVASKEENHIAEGGAKTWHVEFTPNAQLAERGVNLNSIRSRLQDIGKLIEAKPVVKNAGEIAFQFVISTDADESVLTGCEVDGLSFEPVETTPVRPTKVSQPVSTTSPATFVRVDLERLEEVMTLVGELVISRTRLEDQVSSLKRTAESAVWRPLQETSLAMGRQLRDLRDSLMRVRMVPIGEIFERMQFVVRDLARESGKKITVELSGGETEIDKFLVERMMDPLLHLVRNAVSHGLETVIEREAQGKRRDGLLSLSAKTVGESVIVKISDDGRGIDRQGVRDRAAASELISAKAELDNATLLDLICSPGLSTRDGVDRQSGRGVGMDVVRKAVEDLGGRISLITESGKGTTFTIELPLTLAIAEALIVSVNGQRFAVPQSAVREVMEVEQGATKVLENNEIIYYRGGVLPLLRLASLFDMDYKRDDKFHVFVVGDETKPVGIGVDRIIGQQEIVVRGITDPLVQVKGIAGATELGDQRVVLILDVGALRQFASSVRH
jgi:two-component system chemotaxis sensor kinase CheA